MKMDLASIEKAQISSIFLYGSHEAFLMHKVNTLATRLAQANSAQVTWVDQQTFLGDPSYLHNQGDLFSKAAKNKVIIIEDATDKSASTLDTHLDQPKSGVQIIIPALVGSSTKKLKAIHEKAKNAAFVTCYLSQVRDKQAFLNEMTQEIGLSLSREAQIYALQNMEDNVEATLSALQKLPFYVELGQEVSVDDFLACMSDFREANVQPIVSSLGDRLLSSTLRAYHEAKALGAEEIAIIRSLNQHFSKLLHLRSIVSSGSSVQQALQSMRPPVFFKEQDEFVRHHTRWTAPEISLVMDRLNSIELQIKTGYPFDPSQLWKPVFSMCKNS